MRKNCCLIRYKTVFSAMKNHSSKFSAMKCIIMSSGPVCISRLFSYWAIFLFCSASSSPVINLENIDGLIDPSLLDESELLEPPLSSPNPFHMIDDCVTVSMEEGVFHYMSKGKSETCGLYLLTDPNKSIIVTVDYLDARCDQKGLISVVDGWELNGQVFPSAEDHENKESRFNDLCTQPGQRNRLRRSYTSSQNNALIQYRLPVYGQRFSVHVRHVVNPTPCNIVVNNDMEGVYTLDNFGQARNCSLTAIFDAKFRIMYMNAGLQSKQVKFSSTPSVGLHRRVLHKCNKMGLGDFVQIGGSSGLDTSKMIPIDDFCGFQPHPRSDATTIFCGVNTVRLVSSGKFHNKVVIEAQMAGIDDLDRANYICDFGL